MKRFNKLRRYLPVLAAVFAVLAAVLIVSGSFKAELAMINEPYVMKGGDFDIRYYFRATDAFGRDVSDRIKVKGEVDTEKTGEYPVSVKVRGIASTKDREVVFRVVPVQIPATEMEDLKGKYANRGKKAVLSFYDNYGKAMFSFSVIDSDREYEGSVAERTKTKDGWDIVLLVKDSYTEGGKSSVSFEEINLVKKKKSIVVDGLFGLEKTEMVYLGDDWKDVSDYLE